MSTLYIFHADGSFSQRESKELAFEIARAINQGFWESYLPFPQSESQAWKAIQLDKRVLVFSPLPEASPKLPELKPRELQTLRLLIAGQSIAQAAWIMHIQVRTVSAHLARLRRKFNARTNFEMIGLAVKYGIVSPEPQD